MINKVLIANRGEIALRIMKTLRQMDIKSAALYTTVEKDDLHVISADEALPLGNGTLSETWLNIPLILRLAKKCGADAVHPGYGFLSENPAFAKACEEAGIIFIGPQSDVIEKMGSKITASQYARNAGIDLLPRLEGDAATLLRKGASLGFPLLVKAAAGGGGKGMIRIDSPEMLHQAVFSAAEQARRYFNDDCVYLEKYIRSPRHIEVQVLADHHGNVVHLHERECTLQRNHQKVIEEAPSVSLDPETRQSLHQSAVNLAKATGYTNAGTVEYILDEEGRFYFLEMNTRIQVEHPVTELITGIDIIKEQIRIAMGETLSFAQEDIKATGHAIEARLYAEDPANHFRPSAGVVKRIDFPRQKNIRIDAAMAGSGKVHPSFDAMIAKICSYGTSRDEAIRTMGEALNEVMVHGITTNIRLLAGIINDALYRDNQITTHTIADNLRRWTTDVHDEEHMIIAAGLFIWLERYSSASGTGAWRLAAREKIMVNQVEVTFFHFPLGNHGVIFSSGEQHYRLENISYTNNRIHFCWNHKQQTAIANYSPRNSMFLINGLHYQALLPEAVVTRQLATGSFTGKIAEVKASLFGRVLKVNVIEKQKVKMGDALMIIESMKMENAILAPADQTISAINVKEGDQVSDGQILISFEV
jgi:3-methylcrotonyl-CoA carboxylase alpha subunit